MVSGVYFWTSLVDVLLGGGLRVQRIVLPISVGSAACVVMTWIILFEHSVGAFSGKDSPCFLDASNSPPKLPTSVTGSGVVSDWERQPPGS